MNREITSSQIIGGLLVVMLMLSYNTIAQNTDQKHNIETKHSDSQPVFVDKEAVAKMAKNFESAKRDSMQHPMKVLQYMRNLKGKKVMDIGAATGTTSKKDWTIERHAANRKGYELDAQAFIKAHEAKAIPVKATAEDETKSIDIRKAAWAEYYALQRDIAYATLNAEVRSLLDQQQTILNIERKAVKDRTYEEKELLLQKENTLKELTVKQTEYHKTITELATGHSKENADIDKKEQQRREKELDTLFRNIDAAARSGLQTFDNYYEQAAQYEIESTEATGRKAAAIRRRYLVDAINDVKQQIEDLKDVEGVTQSTIDAYVKYLLKLRKQLPKK